MVEEEKTKKPIRKEVINDGDEIKKTLALLGKLKKQDEVRKALHRIFYAACLNDARDEAKQFLSRYSREFPTAAETLTRHLEECLTFYRFPEREAHPHQ